MREEELSRCVLDRRHEYPLAIVRETALTHNIESMAAYCQRSDALLAPHAKTTMAPEIFRRQLAAGAWGLTIASVTQARIAWQAGARRLLIANELMLAPEIEWVCARLRETPDARVLSFVDDPAVVARLDAQVEAVGLAGPLEVLIELGYRGGRAGCRDLDCALAVAQAVAAAPHLRLVGVAAFEGLLVADAGPAGLARIDEFLTRVARDTEALAATGLLGAAPIVSAGGSAFFDRVVAILGPVAAAVGGRLMLRSGCYVTHDHGVYERIGPAGARTSLPPFQPAVEVWGVVLSCPEPERVIVGVGKRDVAFDTDPPRPLAVVGADGVLRPLEGAVTVGLDDQHAHLRPAGSPALRPGDLVGFGISHPCAVFDRWRRIHLVDDDYRVSGEIETCF